MNPASRGREEDVGFLKAEPGDGIDVAALEGKKGLLKSIKGVSP